MSGNRPAFGAHFGLLPAVPATYSAHMDRRPSFISSCIAALLGAWMLLCTNAHAEAAADDFKLQARQFAIDGLKTSGPRVEVQVGELDSRLRLAPCEQIEPYLPPNSRLWGRSRIGLRCVKGPSRWNVFLPILIKVFGPALVATRALPAGSVIGVNDVTQAEVDLAEDTSNVLVRSELAVGRTLRRPLDAGKGLRQSHLLPRQWFAAGETVKVVAQGGGFRIAGEAQALTPGLEGQPARVRTDAGRILSGMPVGEREMELHL